MPGTRRTDPNAGPSLRRRPQLSEDVANHVRHLVMSGEVRPGDFIGLDETAAELASVSPVRNHEQLIDALRSSDVDEAFRRLRRL